MAIDFEQGRKKIMAQGRQDRIWKQDGVAEQAGKYNTEDFMYPAKFSTEYAVEDAEFKDAAIETVAQRAAEIANTAGISENFMLTAEYSEMLRENRGRTVSGPMYVSPSRKYMFYVDMGESTDGTLAAEVTLYRYQDGQISRFSTENRCWMDIDLSKEFPESSLRIFGNAVSTDSGAVAAGIKNSFFAMSPSKTEEDWNRFMTVNHAVIDLVGSMKGVLQAALIDDAVYALPLDDLHTGIALGSEEGGFSVWQAFSILGALTDEEVYRYNIPNVTIHMKRVGHITNMSDAERFAEAHMDRSTIMGKVSTIPVSAGLVLHFANELVTAPEEALAAADRADGTGRCGKDIQLIIGKVNAAREAILKQEGTT